MHVVSDRSLTLILVFHITVLDDEGTLALESVRNDTLSQRPVLNFLNGRRFIRLNMRRVHHGAVRLELVNILITVLFIFYLVHLEAASAGR